MKKKTDPETSHPAAQEGLANPAGPTAVGYSRLHITPLDPTLLKVIVPPAVLPNARRISYHTIQTFPEKPYGFLDLPTSDADKIKKKLNGAVLKGTKIRIEPARPDNMPQPSPDATMDLTSDNTGLETISKKSTASKKHKKDKKRKRDPQEIVGVELEEGRKVKRGWTVTPEEALAKKAKENKEDRKLSKSKKMDKKDKKDKKKKKRREPESLYSNFPECLVKTQLPPNKLGVIDDGAAGHEKKSKKSKKRDIVVHEFERNTKFATFLKTTQTSAASGTEEASFVEGRGWVGHNGVVVEEVKSTRPKAFPKIQVSKPHFPGPQTTAADDTSSSSSSSSSSDDSSSEDESPPQQTPAKQLSINVRPSSSIPHSSVAIDSAEEPDSKRPESSGSSRSLTVKIPPTTPTPGSSKMHPLEALYKRHKDQPINSNETADPEPFAFFGSGEGDDEDDGPDGDGGSLATDNATEDSHLAPSQGSQAPMTPFTKQDLDWRITRSAAPTPDTAHPSRTSRFWPPRGDDEYALDNVEEDTREEEEEDDAMAYHSAAPDSDDDAVEGSTNPNTDFQKWFWEHRGDLNRSWKKRRKLAAKEKRYRENKARADRAI